MSSNTSTMGESRENRNMTEALTRLFRRTKHVDDPEYLPPYFWHRYLVWQGLISLPAYVLIGELVDWIVSNEFWFRDFVLAIVVNYGFSFVAPAIRKQWAQRQEQDLYSKLSAWRNTPGVSDFEVGEVLTKFTLFRSDLQDYAVRFQYSPLSIHRTDWSGDGTRYTIYRRGHRKRVVTFYHP